ncbi:MAG: outer membrane beta-barrel protein [Spirochaetes bacterium]|nr:outer membrane beta-barrel protein [Spirochaetota bacterium]
MRNNRSRVVPRLLTACCAIVVFLVPSSARAQQYLGVGFHVGAHHDVGNMSSYNSGFEIEPQTSCILGVSFKANLDFLFLRTGVDIAFPLTGGDVLENSDPTDPVEKYSISYTGLPLFLGINFPVFDIGEFYLGGGIAYFLATGTVTHGGTEDDISASALGFGFIAGMQLRLTAATRLYMEWEYIDARSGATMNTSAAPATWDNLYIDFTGHRILLGIMYYAM